MNPHSKEIKRIKSPHETIVESQVIHQTNVGAMESQSLMVNFIVAISMGIEQVNAQRTLSLKDNVSHVTNKVIRHLNADQNHPIQQNKL